MREIAIVLSKLSLSIFGVLILFLSKNIPGKLIGPRDSKFNMIQKELFIQYVRRCILYLGYTYISLGILSTININIQLFMIIAPVLISFKINKFYVSLKKYN